VITEEHFFLANRAVDPVSTNVTVEEALVSLLFMTGAVARNLVERVLDARG
jgi:hypothetical protein